MDTEIVNHVSTGRLQSPTLRQIVMIKLFFYCTSVEFFFVFHRKSKVPLIRSTSLSYASNESQEMDEEWWTEEGEEEEDEDETATASNKSFYRKRHYPPKPDQLTAGNTLPVAVVFIKTRLSVVWQDGSEEEDVPSTQLHYSNSLDDHEFFPGEWVIFCDKSLDKNYGVVQSANNVERTAIVSI